MSPRQIIPLACAWLATLPAAHGQSAGEQDEVLVVATRIPADPDKQVRDIQIVDEQRLQQHADMASALSAVPGLHIQSPGGRSGFASLFLDGADPNFTIVLLDGVPLNNPANTRGGAVNVAAIESSTFTRAELARGSYTSIHGSGALAGAINLVVPAGLPAFGARGELTAGENGSRSAFLRAQGPLFAGFGGSFSASIADDGSGPGGSSFEARSATIKIAPLTNSSGDPGSLLVRVSRTEAGTFPDSSGGDRYAARRQFEQRESTESLFSLRIPLQLTPRIAVSLGGSWLDIDSQTDSPGIEPSAFDPFGIPAGVDDTRYQRLLLKADSRVELDAARLVFGVEHQFESGESEGELDFFGFRVPSGFSLSRDTTSAYAELSRRSNQWTWNASSRIDRIEELGSRVTASAAARYQIPGKNLALRLSFGTGYKAPSLYALGNPFVGNSDLRPESSTSWRGSLEWARTEGSTLSLSAFHTRYANLIDFEPGPPPRLENRSAVQSRGADLLVEQRLAPTLRLTAHAQYSKTVDRASDSRLLDRPGKRGGAGFEWTPTASLAFSAQLSYVGGRRSYSIPTGIIALGGYQDLQVAARWQMSQRISLRISAENLLDQNYQHAVGFSSQSRRLRMGVSGAL